MQTNGRASMDFSKPEMALFASVAGLVILAAAAPALVQPAHQHAFADQRVWLGIPFAGDVLSNLAFVAWGVAGWICLRDLVLSTAAPGARDPAKVQYPLVALFFAGLLATAAGSGYYHFQPGDAGLAMDRLGMVVAFAGLLGLAAAGHISSRAGVCMAALVLLLLGPASIGVWLVSANILPWVVLQFGGMALIVWLAFAKPLPGALPIRWGWVIAVYAIAKVFEHYDHAVFEWTRHQVSGHSIKHLVASFAALPVCAGLWQRVEQQSRLSGLSSVKNRFFQASNRPSAQ